MYQVIITEAASKDLDDMDDAVYNMFNKHFDKIAIQPPRKHAKHGLPFFTENVGQGRISCYIVGDKVYVMRCFEHHNEYDKWLSMFI